ncbi:tripartite tricarboxylate transporter substrate-binding protein [Siccirubricoccus deserti]
MLASSAAGRGLVEAGRLRVLAVAGRARLPLLPAVPTVTEALPPGFELAEWSGIWAPAGTPELVLDRVAAAAGHALGRPEMRARMPELGMDAAGYQPRPEFERFVRDQRALMTRLAVGAGIRPE